MSNDSIIRALIATVVQAPPPESGGAEDAMAAVAERAKYESPDLAALRFPHILPKGAGEAGFSADPALDDGVTRLVATVPKNLRRLLALSVVDLSGSKTTPRYAGYQDRANFDSASVGKICGLLAAYQFLADANHFLAQHPSLASLSDLTAGLERDFTARGLAQPYPRAELIFDFHAGAVPTVTLRRELQERLEDITTENENGSTPIVLLNYPYVASVMLAYGLFDTTRLRGFWLRSAWGPIKYPTSSDDLSLPLWQKSPYKLAPKHSVSSLAAAKYFTLAAQGNLVDAATSQSLLKKLGVDDDSGGCAYPLDVSALEATGTVSAKCGYYEGRGLVALHYKATVTARELVICVFTIGDAQSQIQKLFDGLLELL